MRLRRWPVVLPYDGVSWRPVPTDGLPPVGQPLTAATTGRVWVAPAGAAASVAAYTASGWTLTPLDGTSVWISAIAARTATDAWVVGTQFADRERPLLLHLNGDQMVRSYGPVPEGTHRVSVYAVTTGAAGETVWAAGSTGTGHATWGHPLVLRTDLPTSPGP